MVCHRCGHHADAHPNPICATPTHTTTPDDDLAEEIREQHHLDLIHQRRLDAHHEDPPDESTWRPR